VKPRGATTRDAAIAISERHGLSDWLDPKFQNDIARASLAYARMPGVSSERGRKDFDG